MTILLGIGQIVRADMTELIVGLIALIFVIIRQVLEANKQAAPQRNRPAAPPAPQQPAAKNAPPAGQQADALRNQVEEFLRRAGKPQGAPERPVQPAAALENEVRRESLSDWTERRTLSQQSAPPKAAPPPAQAPSSSDTPRPARRPPKTKRRQSVAEHVAEQVESRARNIAAKSSRLGQRIVAEDERFDVQLKTRFDHTLGTLAGSGGTTPTTTTAPSPETSAATQIAAMLANPDGVRQAMIINEILRRPSDRW